MIVLFFDEFMNRKEVKDMLFSKKEKGQGLVEYALILVLVSIVVIVIMGLMGEQIGVIFSEVTSTLGG
jgi:pilus assembly protein Flp/PilA